MRIKKVDLFNYLASKSTKSNSPKLSLGDNVYYKTFRVEPFTEFDDFVNVYEIDIHGEVISLSSNNDIADVRLLHNGVVEKDIPIQYLFV